MALDIEELHENAQSGGTDERLAPVSVSMAVIAVVVSVVSLMGARIHADEMVAQTQETDQWSQYQAKVIRERSYEVLLDELSVFSLQNVAAASQVKDKYSKEITRYNGEMKDIQNQANTTEVKVATLERRSNWFDFSEVLLESSLVICSITILTMKRFYWFIGLALGGSGVVIAVLGMFVH